MDPGILITLSIVLGLAFLVCSQANDKNGNKYGVKKMSLIWSVAVGIIGVQAIYQGTMGAEGGENELSIVPFALLLLPFLMIGSNIMKARKRKHSEQGGKGSPHVT